MAGPARRPDSLATAAAVARGLPLGWPWFLWPITEYPDIQMFRMGAMAPMYPFMTSSNNQVGITEDHRAYYDILRRLRSIFKIDMDLSELERLGARESQELLDNLERLGRSNSEARQIIDQVRMDYQYTPYVEPVELDPALDQALENILRDIDIGGELDATRS